MPFFVLCLCLQWLHIVAASTYTIDLMRRSPHVQVFSPFCIAYFLVDRIIGLFFYRTGLAQVGCVVVLCVSPSCTDRALLNRPTSTPPQQIIHSEQLDQEYTIVFLYVPNQKRRRLLGSGYYFGFPGLEGAQLVVFLLDVSGVSCCSCACSVLSFFASFICSFTRAPTNHMLQEPLRLAIHTSRSRTTQANR
jgi:hypothetical protein